MLRACGHSYCFAQIALEKLALCALLCMYVTCALCSASSFRGCSLQMAAAVSVNGSANPDFMGFQQVTLYYYYLYLYCIHRLSVADPEGSQRWLLRCHY